MERKEGLTTKLYIFITPKQKKSVKSYVRMFLVILFLKVVRCELCLWLSGSSDVHSSIVTEAVYANLLRFISLN